MMACSTFSRLSRCALQSSLWLGSAASRLNESIFCCMMGSERLEPYSTPTSAAEREGSEAGGESGSLVVPLRYAPCPLSAEYYREVLEVLIEARKRDLRVG